MLSGTAFAAAASGYTITPSPTTQTYYPTILVLSGAGIMNDSGLVQNYCQPNDLTLTVVP